MRVDPDGVYLEVVTGALIWNMDTGRERRADAVTLHFKDGRKWRRVSFHGREEGDNLEGILGRIGAWIDQHGLRDALAQIGERP